MASKVKRVMSKKKCKWCKQPLSIEYQDCCLCGGGEVYLCNNEECCRMYDFKGEEV